jgi:hypothetical protein
VIGRALLVVAVLAFFPEMAWADVDLVEKSTVEVAPAGRPIEAITVINGLGAIRVEGHDGAGLIISTVKRASSEEVLERLRVSLIPDPDGSVRISTAFDQDPTPGLRAREVIRIDLVIRAPRSARVDARIDEGQLELLNMDAGGELDSSLGAITVKNVSGPVVARSLDAALSFSQVFGIVDAQALVGDVYLEAVRGQRLSASAHRGRIVGRRIQVANVELITTAGDIAFEGLGELGGRLLIASLAGDVDVRLGAPLGVHLIAMAPRLEVMGNRKPDGRFESTWGRGDNLARVELRSRRGAVRFAIVQ